MQQEQFLVQERYFVDAHEPLFMVLCGPESGCEA
jgi:hypothetical protein